MSDIERSGGHEADLPKLARYREITIDILTKGYADDLIGVNEFERRVEQAHNAPSYRELEALVADLPSEYRRALPVGPSHPTPPTPPSGASEPRVFAILSEREISGDFFDRDFGSAVAVMGSLHVDLTDVHALAENPVLHVFGLMSDIKVSVPPDVRVELQLTPILADVKLKGRNVSKHTASRTLRVTGMAVMSDVKIVR